MLPAVSILIQTVNAVPWKLFSTEQPKSQFTGGSCVSLRKSDGIVVRCWFAGFVLPAFKSKLSDRRQTLASNGKFKFRTTATRKIEHKVRTMFQRLFKHLLCWMNNSGHNLTPRVSTTFLRFPASLPAWWASSCCEIRSSVHFMRNFTEVILVETL